MKPSCYQQVIVMFFCAVAVVVVGLTAPAIADPPVETYWDSDTVTAQWTNSTYWDNGVPVRGDFAHVVEGTVQISSGCGAECDILDIDAGTVHLRGGTLTVQEDTEGFFRIYPLGKFLHTAGTADSYSGGSGVTLQVKGHYEMNEDDGPSLLKSAYVAIAIQYEGTGTGLFEHDEGTHETYEIWIGRYSDDSGTYILGDAGASGSPVLSVTSGIYAGYASVGVFQHNTGTNMIDDDSTNGLACLYVGLNSTSDGEYRLGNPSDQSATPQLTAEREKIGWYGEGLFKHIGGTNTISTTDPGEDGELCIAHYSGAHGTYLLGLSDYGTASPQLTAEIECVGSRGTGDFVHDHGTNDISGNLYLGYYSSGDGDYKLGNSSDPGLGYLEAANEIIGKDGIGTFTQYGGINTVEDSLYVGGYISIDDGTGTYTLDDGTLTADNEYIGHWSAGQFSQDGGVNTVAEKLFIAFTANSHGTYTMDGGALVVEKLFIGDDGTDDGTTNYVVGTADIYGTFDINDSTADIDVGNKVVFGLDSEFEATANSEMTIELGEDDSTAPETGEWLIRFVDDGDHNPNELDGLGNLTLNCEFAESIISGDTYNVANVLKLEACGEGKNPNEVTVNDFTSANFVIDKLVIGRDDNEIDGEAGKITVNLMDAFDNQNDGTATESIYVRTLEMKAGAEIGGGPQLYYRNGGNPKQFRVGDTNLDGAVDIVDLTALAANWYGTGLQWSQADFNGDRIVDIIDLTALAADWGGEGDLGTAGNITVDTTAHDTDSMTGYITIEVTLSTGDTTQIMCGFDLTFDADTMNQINPFGVSTVFEDANFGFPYVGASVDQDSQFEFHTSTDQLQVQEQSESGTSLAAAFALRSGVDNDNASDQVLVAHVVVPSDVEVSLTGFVIIYDAATNELIDTFAVDETLNEQ